MSMCDSSLITLLSHFISARKTTEDVGENFGAEVWRKLLSLHARTRRIPRRILPNEQMVAQILNGWGGGGGREEGLYSTFFGQKDQISSLVTFAPYCKRFYTASQLNYEHSSFSPHCQFFPGEKRSGGSTRKRKQIRRVIIRDFSNFSCRWCNRQLCPIKRP